VARPGRFVVRCAGHTTTGLSAGEVHALLATEEGAGASVLLIRRVDEQGRMELAGVSGEALSRVEGLQLAYATVALARAAYDRIAAHGRILPPPCDVELHLSRVPSFAPPHVVALACCAACTEAVIAWLRGPGGDELPLRGAGAEAHRAYLSAPRDIVLQAVLGTDAAGDAAGG
jgi:hypothetical protein